MSDEKIDGEYKFQNCKHRSTEESSVVIKRCACQGGDYNDTGYECLARKIFKVEPNICEYCYMFEKK
jgi:hypothetical protein